MTYVHGTVFLTILIQKFLQTNLECTPLQKYFYSLILSHDHHFEFRVFVITLNTHVNMLASININSFHLLFVYDKWDCIYELFHLTYQYVPFWYCSLILKILNFWILINLSATEDFFFIICLTIFCYHYFATTILFIYYKSHCLWLPILFFV